MRVQSRPHPEVNQGGDAPQGSNLSAATHEKGEEDEGGEGGDQPPYPPNTRALPLLCMAPQQIKLTRLIRHDILFGKVWTISGISILEGCDPIRRE